MTTTELFFFNGSVCTVDPARPTAEAVAVRDGRIVAVGPAAECRRAVSNRAEGIDLRGRALLPGFIDTHLHPLLMVYHDLNVDLRGIRSIEEMQARLRAAAEERPDGWIVGLDLEEQNLREKRLPTRHDLDAACPGRPVVLLKHDLHTAVVNTQVIDALGVTAATPNPDGGVIDREPDGHPAGAFRENAARLPYSALPMPAMESLEAGAKRTFQRLAASGITSIGAVLQSEDEGPAGASGAYDVTAMAMLLPHAPVNVYSLLIAGSAAPIEAARQTPLHQSEPGGHHIGAVKIFADGTLGSCTALMFEPFSDAPDKTGFLTHEPDEIYRRMELAHRAGLQIAMHVIGDAGNRTCVDLFDRLLRAHPRADHRHRLEHASVLRADIIADLRRLGLIVGAQPLFIHSEKEWLPRRLGPARVKWTYPLRALVEAGVKVVGASDAPVESIDVLHALQCCVTREGFEPQQGLTIDQALRMYTSDAAYAQFEEDVKGSLAVGKRADLVILSDDPRRVPADRLATIRVERTFHGGRTTYQRDRS
jgi:predicted amidohydrolase YtcJ